MKYIDILGKQVQDSVTRFAGVATSVSFDLYGCVQVAVTPPHEPSLKAEESYGRWFDHKRLVVLSPEPVMRQPEFFAKPAREEIGPEPKAPQGWHP